MQISPVEVVLRVASACEGASEVPPASNRGPFVERCQALASVDPGAAWCAAWLCMVGVTALQGLWPLPRTAGCQVLADFAKGKNCLVDKPQRGDVFLIWHPELGRFAHTGFVLDTKGLTISGNTTLKSRDDPQLAREGWAVAKKVWTFKPEDRYVRWRILLNED